MIIFNLRQFNLLIKCFVLIEKTIFLNFYCKGSIDVRTKLGFTPYVHLILH